MSTQADRAKRYIDQLNRVVERVSRNAALWATAIAVIWWGSIERPYLQGGAFIAVSAKADKLERRAEEYRARIGPARSEFQPPEKMDRDNLDAIRRSLGRTRGQQDELKNEIEKGWQLPGFNLQVSAPYAALVWTIAAFGLIRYLLSRRALTYIILGRALTAVAGTEADERADVLHLVPEAPWWLAPFPSALNAVRVSASDALGYRGSDVQGAVTVLVFGLVVLAMEFAAIPAAVRLTLLFGTPIERLMVPALTVSAVVLTGFALVEWMRPVDLAATAERAEDDRKWWPDRAWPGWRRARIPVVTGLALATMYLSSQLKPAIAAVEIVERYPAVASIAAGATVWMLVIAWLKASAGWRWFAATHIDHRPDERNAQRARHFGRAVAAGAVAAFSYQAVSAVAAPPRADARIGRRRRRRTARPPRVRQGPGQSHQPAASQPSQLSGARMRVAAIFRPHASADLKPWLTAVPVALVCGFELTREMFARRRPADRTVLSRRQWAMLLVAIAAGSVFAAVRSPSASARTYRGRRRPRHWKSRKHSSSHAARVQLNEGFYRRSGTPTAPTGTGTADSSAANRSTATPHALVATTPVGVVNRPRALRGVKHRLDVAHYVNSDHTVACTAINERHFTRMSVQEVTAAGAPIHVHLSCASVSFERAALGSMPGSTDERLALLLAALRHDARFKSGTRRRPDFRLYDLAAGLAVRYDRGDALKQVVDLARQVLIARRGDAFVSKTTNERLAKWSDPESPWRQYWKATSTVPWNRVQIGRTRDIMPTG